LPEANLDDLLKHGRIMTRGHCPLGRHFRESPEISAQAVPQSVRGPTFSLPSVVLRCYRLGRSAEQAQAVATASRSAGKIRSDCHLRPVAPQPCPPNEQAVRIPNSYNHQKGTPRKNRFVHVLVPGIDIARPSSVKPMASIREVRPAASTRPGMERRPPFILKGHSP
jgi:hypothetical protein